MIFKLIVVTAILHCCESEQSSPKECHLPAIIAMKQECNEIPIPRDLWTYNKQDNVCHKTVVTSCQLVYNGFDSKSKCEACLEFEGSGNYDVDEDGEFYDDDNLFSLGSMSLFPNVQKKAETLQETTTREELPRICEEKITGGHQGICIARADCQFQYGEFGFSSCNSSSSRESNQSSDHVCCVGEFCPKLPPIPKGISISHVSFVHPDEDPIIFIPPLLDNRYQVGSIVHLECPQNYIFASGESDLQLYCDHYRKWKFLGSKFGRGIEEIKCVFDPCSVNPCKNSHECIPVLRATDEWHFRCTCPSGWHNVEGICIDCKRASQVGCPCKNDRQCPARVVCNKGKCTECLGPRKRDGCPCEVDDECNHRSICHDKSKTCVTCDVSPFRALPHRCPCSKQGTCHPGQVCTDDGRCNDCNYKSVPGCPCVYHSQCCRYRDECVCLEGRCSRCPRTRKPLGCTCTNNEDKCDHGLFCNGVCMRCRSTFKGAAQEGCPCNGHSDCESRSLCIEGVCKSVATYKKAGLCPKKLYASNCLDNCYNDADCIGSMKCCFTGCSFKCLKPVN